MEKHSSKVDHFVSLLMSLEMPFVVSVLNVVWKIVASVRSFSRTDLTPRSFECLERQLECLFRELARLLLQRTVNLIESPERPKAIDWEHRTFRPMETRVGTIRYRRWLYRSDDGNRRRLGTVYLGEMPQEKQVTMTERLTKIITGVLQADLPEGLKIRYVTDAGSLRRSYFEKVLSRIKHPRTGQPLQWSWGVDFFHACEYVSLMGDTLFGIGTAESQRAKHIIVVAIPLCALCTPW